jgi:transketolase
MHADTLYHQMLDREAAIAKAKKEGTPVPDFAPLIPEPAHSARGVDEVSPELQKQWQKKLKKVKEEDREAEENALKAEHRATREVAEKIQSIWDEQAKERASRKEKGQDSVLDKLASLVGK